MENVKTNSEIFIENTARELMVIQTINSKTMFSVDGGLLGYYVNLKLCTWFWDLGLDNRKERDRAVP